MCKRFGKRFVVEVGRLIARYQRAAHLFRVRITLSWRTYLRVRLARGPVLLKASIYQGDLSHVRYCVWSQASRLCQIGR